MTGHAIEVSMVTKSVRDGVTRALEDVSFSVAPGEFVSILGPSGCGKTTILKMVAGLVAPTGGSVTVIGLPVTVPRRDIGIVFQTPAPMRWRTALENMMLPAEILGLDRTSNLKRAADLLDLVGLDGFKTGFQMSYRAACSSAYRSRALLFTTRLSCC